MKPKPPANEHQRYAANLRKPGPVRRLSPGEIRELEHKRNLARWFNRQHSDR